MDIALILLLIAIAILLVVMSLIKYQSHQTSMYERRMNTLTHYQQTLMLAAPACQGVLSGQALGE